MHQDSLENLSQQASASRAIEERVGLGSFVCFAVIASIISYMGFLIPIMRMSSFI